MKDKDGKLKAGVTVAGGVSSGAGKGSRPRPVKRSKWDANYGMIKRDGRRWGDGKR